MNKGYAAKIPFSPAEAQEQGLLAENPKLPVYIEGRDAETYAECLRAFRGEPGELWTFGGYRVLGGSRDAIMTRLRDLKKRKIVVVDKMNNERSDERGDMMLDRALKQIMGSNKVRGSRKHARRIGAKGGHAKGDAAQAARVAAMAGDMDNLTRRICEAPELSWRRRADILGKPWNPSTLLRWYKRNK